MFSHSSRFQSNSSLRYISNLQLAGDPNSSKRFLGRRLELAKSMYRRDLYAHYGCVNAIEFSDDGEWLVSGGDDKRVLIWNVNTALSSNSKPIVMKGEHNSNIFCLSFDSKHEKLFSAGNDEQVISHDVASGETSDVFLHNEAVYGISVDPLNNNLFATACDDGRILLWDTRISSTDALVVALYNSAFHAVVHNPAEPRLLATANAKEGVTLWDIRKPMTSLIRYGCSLWNQSAMSVRFNAVGTHLLCLRRRLSPVLYELLSPEPAASFDHKEYYNSCTMKSCSFACGDKYILSGSDDFKLYMWKIPDLSSKKGLWINKPHAILRGHRSIVNQVRYNETYGMLASSGVEKIIKLWSTFPVYPSEVNYFTDKDGLRKVYSHEEYISLVLESGQFMTHDYSHHSMQEDPRMIAFFDSLVQRDIEGWTSDSSENGVSANGMCYEVQSSGSSFSSVSSADSSSTSSDEGLPCHFTTRSAQTQYSTGLNFSTTLCPSRPSRLGGYNIPNYKADDSVMTSDRISELIAKKRRNQLIKSDKTTKKLKRKLSGLNSHAESITKTNSTLGNESRLFASNVRNVLSSILDKKRKRIEQSKRLATAKARAVLDNSSDSDEESKIFDSAVSINNQGNVNTIVEGNDSVRVVSPAEEQTKRDNNNSNTPLINANVNHSSSLNSDVNNSNRNSSSCSPSAEPTTSFCFQPKNKRRHNRNYRKRNADDSQEED